MNIIRTVACLICLFLSSNAEAITNEEIAFKRITIDDGLSQNSVIDIYQDANGFMWFGTQDGLNRYDGYQHIIFRNDPDNPNSISDNRIRCIYVDSQGILWVGSEGGLSRYNPETLDFINYRHQPEIETSLGHNTVRAILEDQNGHLWVGTRGGGLNRFDRRKKTFEKYMFDPADDNSIGSNAISSIAEDSAGNLWLGTFKAGVSKFDPARTKFIRYQHDEENAESLSHNKVVTLYRDSQDTIWVGTYGGGLNRFDPETGGFKKFRTDPTDQFSLSNNRVRSIYEDFKGRILVGTNSGLNIFCLEKEGFYHYKHDPSDPKSLSENTIQSIFQDLSGVIWVGTKDGISAIIPKKKFHNIGTKKSAANTLNHSSVSSISEEQNGVYWIGTNGGGLDLLDLKKGINTLFTHNENDKTSLSSNDVRAILRDSSNNLWVGTYIGGLNKLNRATGTFDHFVHSESANSISGNYVIDVKEDQEGLIWIGTNLNGLNSFEPNTSSFTHYKNDISNSESLSSNRVWSVFVDSHNTVWAGTYGAGLNRLDRVSKKFRRYAFDIDDKKSLSNNVVLSMFEDSLGRFWVGTQGGLNLFDPLNETFTRYTIQNGLANNVINGIAEDNSGDLWLSTNRGVSKFTPQTGGFNNYQKNDGMLSNQYNPGANIQASDGTIFLGGRKGLTYFSPQEIVDNPYIPPVVFTSFSQSGEKVDLSINASGVKQLNLTWMNNYFEFSFAALNHVLSSRNQYAYMMEGLDNGWYSAGNNHQGRYSSIPPGRYLLKIKGSNNDGLWNEDGDSIKILVTPPPWKTPLAFLLYALLSIGVFLVFFIAQKRKERKKLLEKQNLESLVISRTNELKKLTDDQYKEIDERKKIEIQLQESQRTLATLISNLPGMAYRCSNEPKWPMQFISDGCLGVTGYLPIEISTNTTLNYGDIIYQKDRQDVWEKVQESIQLDKPYELEYRVITKGGEVRWVWEKGRMVEGSAATESHLEGFIADITQQKELAHNLQQSQKMLAIGTLAGGIAHDFNNILSSVIGFTEISLHDAPSGSELEDNLNEVYAAGIRAKELVKQILAFARQADAVLKPVRISKLVKDVLKLIRPSTPTTIDIIPELHSRAFVIANESQLHQVILNLCTNATQSMQRDGGTLKISLRDTSMEEQPCALFNNLNSGNYIKLVVTDDGPGIEANIISNIFDPYFTTKEVGEGSGMGLAMTKGIIESCKGEIQVSSTPGEKTSFTVLLPVTKAEGKAPKSHQVTQAMGSERILFVDDEPQIAKMASLLLENLGYRVTARTSSADALELFRQKPDDYDLIMTDMTMPFLTGDELAVELRKINPDIPIIICTGYSNKMSENEAKSLGINAFAYKPFTIEDFATTIRAVLE